MTRHRIVTGALPAVLTLLILSGCGATHYDAGRAATPEPGPGADVMLPTEAVPATPAPTRPPFVFPTPSHSETNVLVIGTDRRGGGDGTWRTDTIMWVSVRRQPDQIGIISIPRDLWLDIPRIGQNRVNVADYYGETLQYPGGGPGLLAETIRNNLGLRVDHYLRLDFIAFEKVIDAMGGITVNVDCPLWDKFYDSSAPGGVRVLDIQPGEQRMDGPTALMYARSRLGSSDLDRARRQQKVLMGIRERVLQANMLPRIPQLWASLNQSISTDLPLPEILSLAMFVAGLDSREIKGMVIDLSMTSNWTTPQGAMVLLPDPDKIHAAIAGLFDQPPLSDLTSQAGARCPK